MCNAHTGAAGAVRTRKRGREGTGWPGRWGCSGCGAEGKTEGLGGGAERQEGGYGVYPPPHVVVPRLVVVRELARTGRARRCARTRRRACRCARTRRHACRCAHARRRARCCARACPRRTGSWWAVTWRSTRRREVTRWAGWAFRGERGCWGSSWPVTWHARVDGHSWGRWVRHSRAFEGVSTHLGSRWAVTWRARSVRDGLGRWVRGAGFRGFGHLPGPRSWVLRTFAFHGDVAVGRLAGVRDRGRRVVKLVLVKLQVTANPPWLGPSTGIQQGGSTTTTTAGEGGGGESGEGGKNDVLVGRMM